MRSGWFPVGTCVPAGPQDSSVRDAGHAGHWAQRVIEASPVQNGIRQHRIGGTENCEGCLLYFFFSPLLKLHGLGLDGGAAGLEELLMSLRLKGRSKVSVWGTAEMTFRSV